MISNADLFSRIKLSFYGNVELVLVLPQLRLPQKQTFLKVLFFLFESSDVLLLAYANQY